MDRATIKEVLRLLLGPVQYQDHQNWVSVPCPFAKWKHQRGVDSHPSFGVSVSGDTSIYHCFACKSKGKFSDLPEELAYYYKDEGFLEVAEEYFEQEELGLVVPTWNNRRAQREDAPAPPPDPLMLEVFDTAIGHKYLQERKISDQVAEALDLRVDPDDRGVERILFPVFSHTGVFYGYTGRATTSANPKVRDYFGLQKQRMLLGSHLLGDSDHVVLVEGPFDFARLFGYGIPAVAVLHSGLTKGQADILKELGKPVYVMFDNDDAGVQGRKAVKTHLEKHLPLMKVRYPTRNVKDPDQLTKKETYAMLDDARLL